MSFPHFSIYWLMQINPPFLFSSFPFFPLSLCPVLLNYALIVFAPYTKTNSSLLYNDWCGYKHDPSSFPFLSFPFPTSTLCISPFPSFLSFSPFCDSMKSHPYLLAHPDTNTVNTNLSFPQSLIEDKDDVCANSLFLSFPLSSLHPSPSLRLPSPAVPFPAPHVSIWWWSGLEITWLQINTLEEFLVLLKSARQASESPPLCPPTHPGLYNTPLMESDLHRIPVFAER